MYQGFSYSTSAAGAVAKQSGIVTTDISLVPFLQSCLAGRSTMSEACYVLLICLLESFGDLGITYFRSKDPPNPL